MKVVGRVLRSLAGIVRAILYIGMSILRWIDWRFIRPNSYPPGPRGLKAMMNALKAFMSPEVAKTYYPELVKKYGKLVLVPFPLFQFNLIVADGALHHTVTMNFPRGFMQGMFKSIAGDLISTDGEKYHQQKKMVAPHLVRSVVVKHTATVQRMSSATMAGWGNKSVPFVPLASELVQLFTELSAQLLSGGAPVPQGLGMKLVHLIELYQASFGMSKEYKALKADIEVEIQKLLEKAGEEDLGILSNFANAIKTGQMSFEEAIGLTSGFMNASAGTVAGVVAWYTYFLAENPAFFDRIKVEVREVMGNRKEITQEDIRKFLLVEKGFDEATRLGAPVHRQLRQVGNEMRFLEYRGKKYHLPLGAQVFDMAHLIQTDVDVWGPDAKKFNPDKHMDEALLKSLPKGVFLPFSEGMHFCPGMPFAKLEAIIFIALLALHFDKLTIDRECEPVLAATLDFPKEAMLWATPRA